MLHGISARRRGCLAGIFRGVPGQTQRRSAPLKKTDLRAERDDGLLHQGRLEEPGGMKGLKAVPDTEDGLDVLVGVPAQLFAQAAHVDVEGAGADLRTV